MSAATRIPAELIALPQWVAWRYEQRGDKTTKAPIDAKSNGKLTYAKSNDSTTWASHAEALAACERHAELAGIGFCFAPDDGLTGIDLDHVIDPDTGELKPEAAEILERFKDTYIEASPSGTGVRVFCYGKPGRSGKNVGKAKWCEVYSHPSSRYLTVTGNHWTGSATAVTEQQAALDWLHNRFMVSTGQGAVTSKPSPVGALNLDDATLLDKASGAKNGGAFRALWSGDTSGHGGDDSAADLALCSLLAFWTGNDADRMDRLFRQSGLFRPKWDSRRGESGTYGQMTIDKAIAGCLDTYSGRAGVRSEPPAEYRTDEANAAPPPWPDPFPLPTERPQVKPFPPEILPESLRPWIEDIAERLQCPPEFPAVGAMVSLAALVGRKVGIRPKRQDDWLVVPNLWGIIVGRPGVLKSPALQEAMKPLARLEVNAKNQHELAQADADANKAVSDAMRKVNDAKIREAIKKGGDPYEIARLGLSATDETPTRRRYLVNDSSVEKLGELLNENPNGLLVFRDELLGLLYSLERDGQEGARQFYLETWNGNGRFTYDRIGRGTVDIEACCLSVLGSIQPGPLQDYLATAPDDGLIQRFQLAVWPDLEPGWTNVDRWPNRNAKDQAWSVFTRLDGLTPLAIGAIPGDAGGIPSLRFADDAQAEFSDWRANLETRLRIEELHPALETALAKYRSLIPSLALLIHLADCPEGGPVSLPALLKACAWGEYLESHAQRIYSAQTTPALLGAVRLAEKIKTGALQERFTLRDVYRPAWSRLTTVEQAQAAVRVLVDHDWLRAEAESTRGRPRTGYAINPKVGAQS